MKDQAAPRTRGVRSSVLFAETQRFDQPWLVILVRVAVALAVLVPLLLLLFAEPNPPRLSRGLYLTWLVSSALGSLVVLAVAWLLRVSRLESVVRREGVVVRFVPFHARDRVFSGEEIVDAEVVRYSPLREYGGWGIRKGWGDRGWAYNVRGDRGLRLQLAGGKRVLIGTQRPDEIEQAVRVLLTGKDAPA